MVDSPGRGWPNLIAFTFSASLGGAVTGMALVLLGSLIPRFRLGTAWLIGIICILLAIAVLRDLQIWRFWLPENRRQVRQTVLRLPALVGDMMFGFELGTGARTYLPATLPYVVVVVVIVFGEGIGPGLAAGFGFGFARGLVVVDRALRKDKDGWDQAIRSYKGVLPLLSLIPAAALFIILAVSL